LRYRANNNGLTGTGNTPGQLFSSVNRLVLEKKGSGFRGFYALDELVSMFLNIK
jgi:hypothetical protein